MKNVASAKKVVMCTAILDEQGGEITDEEGILRAVQKWGSEKWSALGGSINYMVEAYWDNSRMIKEHEMREILNNFLVEKAFGADYLLPNWIELVEKRGRSLRTDWSNTF